MKCPVTEEKSIRLPLLCLLVLAACSMQARAQSWSDWEKAYAESAAADSITVVSLGELSPVEAYAYLLMPDSVLVEGEPDEIVRRILGFRARHPAVASGSHVQLINNVYTFQRSIDDPRRKDAVVVVLGASGRTTVNVSRAFADDALLRDAMTGRTTFVSFGMAIFEADPSGVLLIEEMTD